MFHTYTLFILVACANLEHGIDAARVKYAVENVTQHVASQASGPGLPLGQREPERVRTAPLNIPRELAQQERTLETLYEVNKKERLADVQRLKDFAIVARDRRAHLKKQTPEEQISVSIYEKYHGAEHTHRGDDHTRMEIVDEDKRAHLIAHQQKASSCGPAVVTMWKWAKGHHDVQESYIRVLAKQSGNSGTGMQQLLDAIRAEPYPDTEAYIYSSRSDSETYAMLTDATPERPAIIMLQYYENWDFLDARHWVMCVGLTKSRKYLMFDDPIDGILYSENDAESWQAAKPYFRRDAESLSKGRFLLSGALIKS